MPRSTSISSAASVKNSPPGSAPQFGLGRSVPEDNLIVACEAIRLHNSTAGRYLELAKDAPTLNAVRGVRGTIFNVGLRVSGNQDYATLFRNRVLQLCEAMMK